MTVLDVGCAMGFFTLPAARLVGPGGRVIAVDLQEKMIRSLRRRIKSAGLLDRVDPRVCTKNDLGIDDLSGAVDFVMAMHVVHEVPDSSRLMSQLFQATRPSGQLLVVEPKRHVSEAGFASTVAAAEQAGFVIGRRLSLKRGHSILFVRTGGTGSG